MLHVLLMVITLVENHGKVGNFSADHSKNFLQKIYLIKIVNKLNTRLGKVEINQEVNFKVFC